MAEALVTEKFAESQDKLEGVMLCFDGAEGPRTVFLCWGLAKLMYGLEEDPHASAMLRMATDGSRTLDSGLRDPKWCCEAVQWYI